MLYRIDWQFDGMEPQYRYCRTVEDAKDFISDLRRAVSERPDRYFSRLPDWVKLG